MAERTYSSGSSTCNIRFDRVWCGHRRNTWFSSVAESQLVTITIGDLPDGFYVEDDGPGIPANERETVLDPGYSTREDGTGFGLSIVRDIAEAHRWDIAVTAGSEGGARFELRGIETE